MAAKKEPLEFTTEIWGLNIVIKGSKLGVVHTTPQGQRKVMWAKMPPVMTKFVNAEAKEYAAEREAEAKLSPAELAEKYEECMGT